jgi:tRNA acetyltransferase TAN1
MEAVATPKRKATDEGGRPGKTRKQWRVPRANEAAFKNRSIQYGDSGIWATCDKGREGKAIGELKDLFQEVRSAYVSLCVSGEAFLGVVHL